MNQFQMTPQDTLMYAQGHADRDERARMDRQSRPQQVGIWQKDRRASLDAALNKRPSASDLTPGYRLEGAQAAGADGTNWQGQYLGADPSNLQQRTAMSRVAPTSVDLAALQRMGSVSGTMRPGDMAAQQQSQDALRAQLGRQIQSQQQAAQGMGIEGGGAELAALLSATGAAGQAGAQDAAGVLGSATMRDLAAQQQMAELARLYGTQTYNEARQLAGAEDERALYNTGYMQEMRARDMDRLARAAVDAGQARSMRDRMALNALQATQADRDAVTQAAIGRQAVLDHKNQSEMGFIGEILGFIPKIIGNIL